MKPEAADYLDKARHCLASAKTIAAAGVPDVAAREAYLRLPRRRGIHFRVHRQGGQNASRRQKPVQPTGTTGGTDRPRSPHLSGGGRQFKAIADYGVGPAIDTVSADDATLAIDTAERFIDTIAQLLLP